MNWNRTLQRIAADSSKLDPAKVLLTIVALPFYVVGWVLGRIWLVLVFAWSAVAVGIDTGRRAPGEPLELVVDDEAA